MRAELAGQRVGVLISGGNIDLSRFAELVGAAPRSTDPLVRLRDGLPSP